MEHAETARVLRAALAQHSRLASVTVRDEDRLDADVGLDSFALLNALLDVEDRLGIEVEQSRLVDVREMTFGQLVAFLVELQEREAGRAARQGAAPSGQAP